VNFTEALNNLKSLFDNVYCNGEEVIVNRKNNEYVVIISLDEYNAIKETEYLLQSKNNREHLLASLKELRENGGTQRKLIE
jgi:antitoxin YefM